jgi:peptide/nickel transport system substrate-binding protein
MNSHLSGSARYFSAAIIVASIAVYTSQASASELLSLTADDKFVVAATLDDMGTLDPAKAYEFSTSDLLHNVYDSLVTENPNMPGEFLPSLAESWQISEDGRVFTFAIRPDVMFDSGEILSPADAVFSLRRLMLLDAAPSSIFTALGLTRETSDAQIFDQGENLVIQLPAPVAPELLLSALSTTAASILDHKTILANSTADDWGTGWLSENTAGTGPFTLYSLSRGLDYVLKARQNHWRGPPKLAKVRVHHVPDSGTQKALLEMGLLDVARSIRPEDIAQLAQNPEIRIQSELTGEIQYLAANMAHPMLSNPAVIAAMRWLVDYEAIAAKSGLAGNRLVHQSVLPQGVYAALDDTPFKFDAARAREILDAADIGPFSVTLLVRDTDERVQIAQAIRDSFAEAGIDISLKIKSGRDVLAQYRAREHDLILEAWIPEYSDPHFNAASFARNNDNSNAAENTGSLAWRNNFRSEDLNAMVDAASALQDPEQRADIYRALQREHRDTAPFVILFQKVEQTATLVQISGFNSGGITRRVSFRDIVK